MSYSLMTRRDLESLLEGVEGLHSAVNIDEWIAMTWRAIRLLVRCDMATQLTVSFATNKATCLIDDTTIDREFGRDMEGALDEHVMQHPAMKFDGKERDAALISDFVTLNDYRKTGFYNEIHHPFGIKYSAVLGVGFSSQGELLGFSADRGTRDYSARETQALGLLCKHVRLTHANLETRAMLLATLQEVGGSRLPVASGALLLSHDGIVIFRNLNAVRILQAFFPNSLDADSALPKEMHSWFSNLRSVRGSLQPQSWPCFIHDAAAGRLTVQPLPAVRKDQVLLSVQHDLLDQRNRVVAPNRLTPREMEVLSLVSQGLTNQEIATQLGAALSTVKSHVTNILRKLDVPNRAAAAQRGAAWFRTNT